MASDTVTERYSIPEVHHATIAEKNTRDTTQQPTIKHKTTSRPTSTNGYLQGCPTGHYHQGCSTGHHHQGCSSRTETCARTNSTQEKVQEGKIITSWYKPYRVTHTFENDGTGSTHSGSKSNSMFSPQQRNGGIHDVRTATPSPTICGKMVPVLCQQNGPNLLGNRRKQRQSTAHQGHQHIICYTIPRHPQYKDKWSV